MNRSILGRCLQLTVACGMAWSGCGDASMATPDVGNATATRTVTGTAKRSYFADSGIFAERSIDLSLYTIAAFVQDGAGRFTRLPGSGDASGHFSIPAVPLGEYDLLFQEPPQAGQPAEQKWLHTAADHLDMGKDVPGRPDLVRATASPTDLVTDLSPMQEWVGGDDVQFFSANLGNNYALNYGNLKATHGTPTTGDTALTDLRFDLADGQSTMPLLDGGKGDHLYVAHVHYSQAAELFSLTDFFDAGTATMQNGQETTLRGQFSPVNQDKSLHLDWKQSAFAAQAPAMSGQPLTGIYASFNLSLMPWGSAPGFIGATPDLLWYYPASPSSDISMDLIWNDPSRFRRAVVAFFWGCSDLLYLRCGRKRARPGSLSTVVQSDIRGSAEAAAQSFVRPDRTLTKVAGQGEPAA